MNLNIKNRTYLVFGVVILLSILMAGTGYFTLTKTSNYNDYSNAFSQLQKELLQARRDEKDFIDRDSKDEKVLKGDKESKYHIKNSERISNSLEVLNSLKENSITEDFGYADTLSLLENGLKTYQKQMDSLFTLYKRRGFKSVGLEGELRNSIHSVEKFDLDYDKADMLMLRRREKDFFLRLDKKYLGKFDADLEKFLGNLEAMKTASEEDSINQVVTAKVDEILPLLGVYKESFHKNVEINELIGLKHDLGIKGDIRNTVHEIEGVIKRLDKEINEQIEESRSSLMQAFWIILGIEILLAVFLAFKFSNRLLSALKQIQMSMSLLSAGKYPEDVVIKTSDELETLGEQVNEIRDRISTAAEFSKEIGTGNLDIEYEDRFSKDVLAQSILGMRDQLKINAAEERKRAWHTEGIAKFGSILQVEKDNLQELSKTLVSHLVNYLGANQAGIFVVNDENENDKYLELTGAYAYDRDKHVEQKVRVGEGLVGQCWQEKKRIFMKAVPDSYINIKSGLGEASPNCVIILPLPYNNDILGVLEMATFNEFDEAQIEFLEEVAKNIAATLSGVRISSRTKLLLEESKMMQENLQAQEEEMRQNMEEMQATQDMMTEKENEYMDKIKGLEKQLRILKDKNDE